MGKAVIFDLDGTLADTLGDIADAANHVLGELSLPTHREDDYRDMIGEGVRVLLERAMPPEARASLLDQAVERFRAHYGEHLLRRTRPYPGIPELLDSLAARGIPMGVLSNKPDAPTRRMVEALFPAIRFVGVMGQRPEVPRKPDPQAALSLARAMEVLPAECLLVGDTRIDMETARAAGMVPIGVVWGFRDRDELERAGARALLTHPRDLLLWTDAERHE